MKIEIGKKFEVKQKFSGAYILAFKRKKEQKKHKKNLAIQSPFFRLVS